MECLLYFDREPWPLDGIKFDTLKELHAKRKPEDLEIDYGMCFLYPIPPGPDSSIIVGLLGEGTVFPEISFFFASISFLSCP